MADKSNNWTREQLLVAFNLYCQLPFGKLHSRNPDIIRLAEMIGRKPGALAMKLVNIASLDPVLRNSGRSGLSGASKMDRDMWTEMQRDWNAFALESQTVVDVLVNESKVELSEEITTSSDDVSTEANYSADTRTVQTQARIGQNFFRRSVLSAYAGRCCITGLAHPGLLVASHIVPWSADKENRLNLRNGLCLSMLHDKAFDQGLIALNPDYTIKVSASINKLKSNPFASEWLIGLEGKAITLPEKFSPALEFIEWHRQHIFN
ncbi:HNH endonuclease [soil metagenome]